MNNYGQDKHSRWTEITLSDLKGFIAKLFLASIQKCNHKSNNWWSDYQLLEFPIMKQDMLGVKIQMILRYLHVCNMQLQPSTKVPCTLLCIKYRYIAQRYKLVFEAGSSLSLSRQQGTVSKSMCCLMPGHQYPECFGLYRHIHIQKWF